MSPRTIGANTRDHLRVCGADHDTCRPSALLVGSPPRVRSRRGHQPELVADERITSACAEQTRLMTRYLIDGGDHLRVCGADSPGW